MYPYLQVDRDALLRNSRAIVEYVKTPVIGVVKCDGYGVSTVEAARAWRRCGVTMLAVSQSEDVLLLRRDGFRGEILLLSPVTDSEELKNMVEADAILPVTSTEAAGFYSQNSTRPVRVHVAIDTGMGRFGIHWANIEELTQIYETGNLSFLGIYSHFAASFEKGFRKTQRQLDRFLTACRMLQDRGYPLGMRHIANSCAALRFPETRLDAVRIGSALVGRLCAKVPIKLENVAVCVAQVVDRKTLQPGDTTGYASVCVAKRQTNAIVVSVGHENGMGLLSTPDNYPMKAFADYLLQIVRTRFSPPYVEYEGHRMKLVGRIGSQYSLFDAGDRELPPGSLVQTKANLMQPWKRREFVRSTKE